MEIKISEVLRKYDTDKANGHHYGNSYDHIFSRIDRLAPLNILEIGTQKGGSLRAWKEFFPNSTVTGLDIIDVVTDENRTNEVNYVVCDIKDYETEDTYDIIIDDGSHFWVDVEHAVKFAITHLNRGGLFVIEDIQDARVWNSKIRGMLPNDFSFETFDLRDVNDQYDDYLILITHR